MILCLVLGLACAGCGEKSSPPPKTSPDHCRESDGPTAGTVRQAIALVPVVVPGTNWAEVARGHTRDCRLYWVQIIPTIASESTPQQLLFFHRNALLGTPTPEPRPYITVLPIKDHTVAVQYRWRVSGDQECCPTGARTVRFQIGPNGKLKVLGTIPPLVVA